jgi:hypothetical protein
MTATTANPFLVNATPDQVVLRGMVLANFWQEYDHCPVTVRTPEVPEVSGRVTFSRGDTLVPFCVRAIGKATQKYEVELTGGGIRRKVEGYGLPDLLESLTDPELAPPLEGDQDFNYQGIGFVVNQKKADPPLFNFCLSTPADQNANLELTVTVRKVA